MNKQTNEYKGTEVTGLRSPLEDSAPSSSRWYTYAGKKIAGVVGSPPCVATGTEVDFLQMDVDGFLKCQTKT